MPRLTCTSADQCAKTNLVRTAVAEFFGTAALVTIGSGAAATLGQNDAASVHSVAAAFGLTLAALMYAMSHAGASQFNPAVSVALFLTSQVSAIQAFINIFFQCCGSMLAGFILSASTNVGKLAPNGTIDSLGALGANHLMSPAVLDHHAIMAEAGGTFFLCMVVIHCICNNGKAGKVGTDAAPIACGFVYYALHITLGRITGCGINPARSTGPSVVSNKYVEQLYIFWLAPLAGAIVAGIVGRFVFMVDHENEDLVAADNARLDAMESDAKALLKAKEGGGSGNAAVSPMDMVIDVGVPANMQGIVSLLQDMREEIHHLHENEREMVLDTKGSD